MAEFAQEVLYFIMELIFPLIRRSVFVVISKLVAKTFFVYERSMRTCVKIDANRFFMLTLFKHVYFDMQTHSALCQSGSLETSMRTSRRLCVTSFIKTSRRDYFMDISRLVLPQSGRYFSVDQKTLPKSFRLDRQGKGSKVSFLYWSLLFTQKVSRNHAVVTYNTSGADDRIANRRKSENSPFLSKKRDDFPVKMCV